MTLDDLIPPAVTRAVADLGLHKVAGAMYGVPELQLPHALNALGARAYLRRKEARAIIDGVAALATLQGEKVAENPALGALMRRAIVPAIAGAGIAAAPRVLSHDPMQQGSALPDMAMGALLGGAGGMLHGVSQLPTPVAEEMAAALR